MDRPDWVHCIGFGNIVRTDGKKTWCGKDYGMIEPFFTDPLHAALNGQNEGRLVACRECVEEIHKALTNGHDDPDYMDAGQLTREEDNDQTNSNQ